MLVLKNKQVCLFSCRLGIFSLNGDFTVTGKPPFIPKVYPRATESDLQRLFDAGFTNLFDVVDDTPKIEIIEAELITPETKEKDELPKRRSRNVNTEPNTELN